MVAVPRPCYSVQEVCYALLRCAGFCRCVTLRLRLRNPHPPGYILPERGAEADWLTRRDSSSARPEAYHSQLYGC